MRTIFYVVALLAAGGASASAGDFNLFGFGRHRAATTNWSRPAYPGATYSGYSRGERMPGPGRLPYGRRYYGDRYFGNFNNRFYGPQYGYF